jgi:hypothetical protein
LVDVAAAADGDGVTARGRLRGWGGRRLGCLLAGGRCGLGADAWVEVCGGDGGWTAAGAGAGGGGLDLLVDGEEGVQGSVDRGGVREVGHQLGVEDDEVGSLLEQIGVFAADAFAQVQWAGGERVDVRRLLHIVASRSRVRDGHR